MTRTNIGRAPDSDNTPTPVMARAELDRTLKSPYFKDSTRKSRFLTYVVEQTLAGHGDCLTASDIGAAVFDRDERFDPQSDPLVRATARRVRNALDDYYLTDGRDDPLRIVIPKGHYRANFERPTAVGTRAAATETASSANNHRIKRRLQAFAVAIAALLVIASADYLAGGRLQLWQYANTTPPSPNGADRERLVVRSVRNISGDPGLDLAATVITREVKLALCCAGQFQIVPSSSPADFELDGTIQEDASGIQIQLLVTTPSGKAVSTHRYRVPRVTGTEMEDTGAITDITRDLAELRATSFKAPR